MHSVWRRSLAKHHTQIGKNVQEEGSKWNLPQQGEMYWEELLGAPLIPFYLQQEIEETPSGCLGVNWDTEHTNGDDYRKSRGGAAQTSNEMSFHKNKHHKEGGRLQVQSK
eukprot:1219300-Amphidinium_carterae.1